VCVCVCVAGSKSSYLAFLKRFHKAPSWDRFISTLYYWSTWYCKDVNV